MSLQEEERLHTVRYVTCFLWCNYQGRFTGMECRVIRSGRGTVLWEPSETVQTAFSVEDDLADADFVIAASSDEVLNAKISDYCRQKKIPVNVVDVKDECSFIFPSMLQEGPVNIAISSGGASPVLTQIIKERIRQVIPEHTGEIAEQLGSLRPEILSLFPESSQKRKEVLRKWPLLLQSRTSL